jgi:hypothetical protein
MKTLKRYIIMLCVSTLSFSTSAHAQLRLSALSEGQWGDLPGARADNSRTLYTQFDFDYTHKGLRAGLRGEGFRSATAERDYGQIAQRYIHYRRGGLQASAGHFYAIAGSGLLAHAFELPGVISEDRGARRRYQIIRDLDGLHVRYSGKNGEVQLLRGTPVDSTIPPGLAGVDRRQGTVQGGSAQWNIREDLELGAATLRYSGQTGSEGGAALNARGRLAPLLNKWGISDTYAELYGEYAQRSIEWGQFFSLDRDLGRALYLSASLGSGAWGLSLEYKDYQNFNIDQINNPPTLVREHDAYLLNRQTHDLLADDEKGFQAEFSYAFSKGQVLTANYTSATRRNAAGSADDDHLREFFAQLESPLGSALDARIFADHNHNRILGDERSLTFGTLLDWRATARYNIAVDIQYQDVNRFFAGQPFPHENAFFSVETQHVEGLAAAVQIQRSNDILESGAEIAGPTYWLSTNLNWQINERHSANVFWGKRRSGLACTAGTCYEVLGFDGIEIRLVNQLF